MSKVPTFRINGILDADSEFDNLLEDVDGFYRRIVQYVINKIDGVETKDTLCYIKEKDNTTTMLLINENGNWQKALGKALAYFERLEEYETCDLIKQIKQSLN